jgi:hypothetical protein
MDQNQNQNQNPQPEDISIGGQFAYKNNPEATLDLAGELGQNEPARFMDERVEALRRRGCVPATTAPLLADPMSSAHRKEWWDRHMAAGEYNNPERRSAISGTSPHALHGLRGQRRGDTDAVVHMRLEQRGTGSRIPESPRGAWYELLAPSAHSRVFGATGPVIRGQSRDHRKVAAWSYTEKFCPTKERCHEASRRKHMDTDVGIGHSCNCP